jgi:protein TonB
MFEESLVESTALLASRKRWPAVAAFGVQAMFAAALLAVPLPSDMPPGPPATNTFSMVGEGPALPFSANPGGRDSSGIHVVRAASSAQGTPQRISSGVSSGLLLAPIQPVYPAIARTTGTQGTVLIQAIISKSGRIESARVQSGPALLQSAALEAVRNARYRPYLLNGEPTEVETTVSITFHMGN